MVTLYIIRSLNRNYRYVGITEDLNRRIDQHNSGRGTATKGFSPFVLVYTEIFRGMKSARIREKFLKSGVGRKYIDELEFKNAQVAKLADALP